MGNPTADMLRRMERRRDGVRAAAEEICLEARSAGREQLNEGELVRLNQAKRDMAALDDTIREYRGELDRMGTHPFDPLVDAHGHDAIDAAIAATQGQFPGHVFALAGPVDAHHDVARFSWGLGRDGDDPFVIGSDVASVGADGRLARVVGFLDRVPT
jgi:hypothetical protein